MTSPFPRWAVVMAARDGRKSWRRLLVYLSATGIGIAALVAAGSFRHNLQEAISRHAKPLLGADLVVQDRRAFDAGAEAALAAVPHPRVRETRLTTMAHFPASGAGRLIELRAVDRGFPVYGRVNTEPAGALPAIFEEPAMLLEENVMAEFGLKPGDAVEVGRSRFRVAAALKSVPGEAIASLFTAPRAYVDRSRVAGTGLVQDRSLAKHRVYFRIPDPAERERVAAGLKRQADKRGWRVSTVADRERSLGRRAQRAERFLNLSALVMLVLGGLGVASIMSVYARDKWAMAATLRCLGAPGPATLAIFVAQGALVGLTGSLIGAALGVAFQAAIPRILSAFVTVDIPFVVSWKAIGSGVAVGASVSFLFTILPLLPLRHAPPLAAFRFAYEAHRSPARDPLVWTCAVSAALILFAFAAEQLPNPWAAAALPAALAAALGALSLLTRLAIGWLRRHAPPGLPFAFRQGLAALFRPNNQTFLLVPGLGLGCALLFVVAFSHASLIRHLSFSPGGAEPNLALIDVQSDQLQPLVEKLRADGRDVRAAIPIVAMRLAAIKGRSVEQLRREKNVSRWALNREYRSTYRADLDEGEEITAGRWTSSAPRPGEPVPVSLEEGIAERFGVVVGDRLSVDVQGVVMELEVASLRKVDWFQLHPNFFMVFPPGVLEEAPHFFVVMTRAASAAESAEIQRLVREDAPNVSSMDLRLVLETLDDYFGKLSFVMRFMGLFVLLTGGLILAGALLATRHERVLEAALLRTLGASRREIRVIHVVEYGLIGAFAGTAGLVLGAIATRALAGSLFDIPFRPDWIAAPAGVAALIALTTLTGLALGRGMLRRPPLETLRDE